METQNSSNPQQPQSNAYGQSIREQLNRELAAKAEGDRSAPPPSPGPAVSGRLGRFFVKDREILAFYQELALMLDCGMPLVKALHTLTSRWQNMVFRGVIADVTRRVEEGHTFSQALERHRDYFPDMIISMVRVGEKSGTLGAMLARIAERGERLFVVKRRVISALIYPAVVLLAAIFVITFVFGVLAGGFEFFKQLTAEGKVSKAMQTLLWLGDVFRQPKFWVSAAVIVVGLVVLYSIAARFAAFRLTRDVILLNVPMVRHFVRQGLLAHFSVVFSTMLGSGVPLQECLQAAHGTTRNEVLRRTIERVLAAVRRGERIAPELGKSAVFPSLAQDVCAVAEETGALDRVFARMAVVYEEKQAAEMEMLGKIMQPAIVIIMALVVGYVVYAFFSTYTMAFQVGSSATGM